NPRSSPLRGPLSPPLSERVVVPSTLRHFITRWSAGAIRSLRRPKTIESSYAGTNHSSARPRSQKLKGIERADVREHDEPCRRHGEQPDRQQRLRESWE